MNKYKQEYLSKKMTPEEIAAHIKSGFVCACPSALGEPRSLVRALGDHSLRAGLKDVRHHITFPQYHLPIYDDEKMSGHLRGVLWFVGSVARKAVNEGRAEVMPCYYKDVPGLWREAIKPDVFYAAVSPMDKHGYFSFGLIGSEAVAQMERADLRFLEVNSTIPRTHGSAFVHISQITGLCESDEPVLALPKAGEIDGDSLRIGQFVAAEVENGSTLQLGWGNVPSAVGQALADKRDLGIHTELFTDSMLSLIECGAVNNSRKNIDRYKNITAFAMGSRKLYDFMDDNQSVEIRAVDYVNDPGVIAQNDKVVSVNAGLEIDFWGQVCAETLNGRPYSSTGGQVDFVRGAQLSKGGRSFITMLSTAKGGELSRVKASLSKGSIVTTSKNEVDCIVTEYGIARLKGKTWSQRAKALIAIAHPKFRENLTFEGKKLNIII
ncbi:MAG: hypothetical protein LBP78_07865 [Acidaminococcales bacterium]|nr:hypothetical protein [Acidaminococcales bacterium]